MEVGDRQQSIPLASKCYIIHILSPSSVEQRVSQQPSTHSGFSDRFNISNTNLFSSFPGRSKRPNCRLVLIFKDPTMAPEWARSLDGQAPGQTLSNRHMVTIPSLLAVYVIRSVVLLPEIFSRQKPLPRAQRWLEGF
jgi:hypothetical protein